MKNGVDALCERARAAGASIEREPADQAYGDRSFTCADPEGHTWSFGQTLELMSHEAMTSATGHTVKAGLD